MHDIQHYCSEERVLVWGGGACRWGFNSRRVGFEKSGNFNSSISFAKMHGTLYMTIKWCSTHYKMSFVRRVSFTSYSLYRMGKKKVFLLAGVFPHSVLSAWYIRGGLLQATNQMLVFWSLILHGGISHCGFTVWCQWLIKGKVRFILLIMYQWWWATQLWSLVACKLFGTVKPNTLPRVMGIFFDYDSLYL